MQFDPGTNRSLDEIRHPADQVDEVCGLRLQFLPTRESKQALCQRRTPLCSLQCSVDETRRPGIAGNMLAQKLQIAEEVHQEIVEIVSDASGQLPDHLHFL